MHGIKTSAIDVGFMWRSQADEDLQIDRLLAYPLVVALPLLKRVTSE